MSTDHQYNENSEQSKSFQEPSSNALNGTGGHIEAVPLEEPRLSRNGACALHYASELEWHVFPIWWIEDGNCACGRTKCNKGKHPITKNGLKNATTDATTIRLWWTKYPKANIGINAGASGLLIVDVDVKPDKGIDGREGWEALKAKHRYTGATLEQSTGSGNGSVQHIFDRRAFKGAIPSSAGGGLDVRADGGYILAPTSNHISGGFYAWVDAGVPVAPAPEWLCRWAANRGDGGEASASAQAHKPEGEAPTQAQTDNPFPYTPDNLAKLQSMLDASPASRLTHDEWKKDHCWPLCWLADACGWPGAIVYALGNDWSNKDPDYVPEQTFEEVWNRYKRESRKGGRKIGSLIKFVKEKRDWIDRSRIAVLKEVDDLIDDLSRQYAVIKRRGGKACILYETHDADGKPIDAYMSFADFRQIEAIRPAIGRGKNKVTAADTWLTSPDQRRYEGVVFDPSTSNREVNGYYNQWHGFGIVPVAGEWPLLRAHIRDVIAAGDDEIDDYIVRWLAWAVQQPDKQAEVALVLRGIRGCGKGILGRIMIKVFARNGLHLSDSNLLSGRFNGHFEDCAYVFADESLWAGDKAGEQRLKRMITEPTLIIEDKGLKAFVSPNRLKILLASNENWVVPTGPYERRFAVTNVSSARRGDKPYFTALYGEIENGGTSAMLYDLLKMELADWHPRENVPQTEALREQSRRSLSPEMQWLLSLMEDGKLPGATQESGRTDYSVTVIADLLESARRHIGSKKSIGDQQIADLIKDYGAQKKHTNHGNKWVFPPLKQVRNEYEKRYGKQDFGAPDEWQGWGALHQQWGVEAEKLSKTG